MINKGSTINRSLLKSNSSESQRIMSVTAKAVSAAVIPLNIIYIVVTSKKDRN